VKRSAAMSDADAPARGAGPGEEARGDDGEAARCSSGVEMRG
jgi:hypothetical protein